MPRKNSLGDLKIPTRKGQAQVSFMRDLRLARELVFFSILSDSSFCTGPCLKGGILVTMGPCLAGDILRLFSSRVPPCTDHPSACLVS